MGHELADFARGGAGQMFGVEVERGGGVDRHGIALNPIARI